MKGHETTRVLGAARDDLVARPPVESEGAEVHAVGGALGEGYVIGVHAREPRRRFARTGVRGALVSVEVRALEVGGPRAQVVRLAHGTYRLAGGWAAATGVEVDEVVAHQGGKHFSRKVHYRFHSFCGLGLRLMPFCIIAAP